MSYTNLVCHLIVSVLLIPYSLEVERPCYWDDYVLMCSNVENFQKVVDFDADTEHLYIFDSNIYEIRPGSLRYFRDLKQLWMPNNNITLLDAGSFNGLLNLEDMDLNSNNIEIIHKGVFNGMYMLQFLDLSYNQIQTIETNSFTGTDSLKDLYLNDNLISNVTALTGNCKSLELLNLSNNRLEELRFTKSCKNLRILNVAGNNLGRFSGNDLGLAITSLDLSDNGISYLQRTDLKNMDNLVQLNLSRNPLFEKNDMGVDLFQDIKLLKVLNISSTAIKKLSVGIFSQMVLLEVLDLSSNNLTYLSKSIFYDLGSLKELYLRDNRLSYFYYDGSLLSKLDLNGNLWNCDSLANVIKKLHHTEILRGNSYDTTNIHGIACYEEAKDFGKTKAYNLSGISDLQKEYLSHLVKTQTELKEIFPELKAFLKESIQNIPNLKNILNKTSFHLQDLGNSIRQQKFDEENLLTNITDALRLLQKLANELSTLKNETDFREASKANNDDAVKQLIKELKNTILTLNNNFLNIKTDTSSIKSLETIQSEAFTAIKSPASNKVDTVAFYCILAVLLAILCVLILKQHDTCRHPRITRGESNAWSLEV